MKVKLELTELEAEVICTALERFEITCNNLPVLKQTTKALRQEIEEKTNM